MEEQKNIFLKFTEWFKLGFANRLVTYYIIYWLLFNWKITVALFWYDIKQIEAEGCRSTFEFISDQLENNSHWCTIFISALVSTLTFPVIKMLILAFDARISVSRKNWISRINKDEFFSKYESLKKTIEKLNDRTFLQGRWRVEITNRSIVENEDEPGNYTEKKYQKKCFYNIKGDFISENSSNYEDLDKYKIVNFCFTEGRNEVIVRTVLMSNYQTPSMNSFEKEMVYFLNIENDGNGRVKLTGYEKDNYIVMLKIE